MADPAWGTLVSLSEEETTRTFYRTEPLPTQNRWPLDQQRQPAALRRQPCSDDNAMHHPLGVRNAAGYPTVPLSVQHSDVSPLLVEIPSTDNNDWRQLQQQRELLAQEQQQKQWDMQLHLQAQMPRGHKVQNQRKMVEFHYTSGMNDIEQLTWNDDILTQGLRPETNRRFVQCQQLSSDTTTPFPLFGAGCEGNFLVELPMSRDEVVLSPQQVPRLSQSHLQTQPSGTLLNHGQQWDNTSAVLFAKDSINLIPKSQIKKSHGQQPQPYHSTRRNHHCHYVANLVQNASESYPSEFALNEIMKQFHSSVRPEIGISPATGTSYVGNAATQRNELISNLVTTKTQVHPPTETHVYNPHVPLSSTRTIIVPGISLASEPTRHVTIQDLLNGDDKSVKVDMAKSRKRGGKQKRDFDNRRMLLKKMPFIYQKRPQQQSERSHHPSTAKHFVENTKLREGSTLLSQGASALNTKQLTPPYQVYKKSRAAQMEEETNDLSILKPNPLQSQSTREPDRTTNAAIPDTSKCSKNQRMGASVRSSTTRQADNRLVLGTSALQVIAKREEARGKIAPACSQPTAIKSHIVGQCQRYAEKRFGKVTGATLKRQQHRLERSQQIFSGNGGAPSKKRRRAKLPTAQYRGMTSEIPKQESCDAAPSYKNLQLIPELRRDTTLTANHGSPAPDPSCVENRTVVIFCKRDFMRYQAAKIWRKYQEQLHKQEEWREVRIAGKRTRYLNSRYDDLQRTHQRKYTRSGKPHRNSKREVVQALRRAFSAESADLTTADIPVSF
ncbi:uncharacterized protein PHALS_04204 [Plasmopara halstedii]|uniref:Uncharacterized protein n=1 Tax=Plasmopara halstedii TaxID=4781 RepID=A0A0N7L3V8_PLAHL|nr:uncharacterized protein PHALS_04204 [Plasmopara halstedii]CEG36955.1 hypothetical protein PHALS_04204 [Plasmopara halstedii]|eukprot:XP_024573324.1 hypothetical protein PHALS_04204 [Plasmopara halstedii]